MTDSAAPSATRSPSTVPPEIVASTVFVTLPVNVLPPRTSSTAFETTTVSVTSARRTTDSTAGSAPAAESRAAWTVAK